MDISNLANVPVEFTIGKKTFKVKRLSLLDLFGEFEADIKKNYMDDIIELASRITDIKERIEFQKQSIKDMPKGKILEDQVRERMDSFDGGIKILYLALKKCNTVTLEEVKELLTTPEYSAQITTIMDYIAGNDVKKEEVKVPDNATVIKTNPEEKKT